MMSPATTVVVVDYGVGNLGSIANILKKVGASPTVSSSPEEIRNAGKLILPGVGTFDHGMIRLKEYGLLSALTTRVLEGGVPILGICLGMQLMTRSSEEGHLAGLGWIAAETVRFAFADANHSLKVPHMGWNSVRPTKETPLFRDFNCDPRFYFVHSFHAVCDNEDDVLGRTDYGYSFVSAFQRGNITGVQFHPEKSHKYGMTFFSNWLNRVTVND
jgi:glutamine amidotransferase